MNNEMPALVAGVLADLDGAGALADWLEEHDRQSEAVLLRRRWKMWKTLRARNAYYWRAYVYAGDPSRYDVYSAPDAAFYRLAKSKQRQADVAFREYIRERFERTE